MMYEWNGGDERFCVRKGYKSKREKTERMEEEVDF